MEPLNLALTLLSFAGFSPNHQNLFANIRAIISMVILFSISTLSLLDVLLNWTSIESLGKGDIIPVYYKNIFTIIIYLYEREKWKQLINNLETFWGSSGFNEDYKKRFASNMKIGYICTKYYTLTMFVAVAVFFANALIRKQLPFSVYPICDTETYICYFGIFCTEFVSNTCSVALILGFEVLYIYLINSLYCEFDSIAEALRIVDIRGDTRKAEKDIYRIIRHHSFILNFVQDMNRLYKTIFFLQYWMSVVTICIALFIMFINGIPPDLDRFTKYSTFIVVLIFQLFIYSTGGTLLIEQSIRIGDVAFETDWWIRTQPEIRKSLSLMIQRSHRPAKLEIGGMTDMTLQKFPEVLRTALSFVTLMQNLNEND